MQSFQHLVNRFYHGIQDHYSILLIGLDNAGKTSFLYLVKEGKQAEITIPTIGFNVETVRPPTFSRGEIVSKGSVEMTMCEIGMPGGASRSCFYALRRYAECGDAVIWVVDSVESELFRESVAELRMTLKNFDARDENGSASRKPNPRPLLMCVSFHVVVRGQKKPWSTQGTELVFTLDSQISKIFRVQNLLKKFAPFLLMS